MDEVAAMKAHDSEEFQHLVKMHLSFLLDLRTTAEHHDDLDGDQHDGFLRARSGSSGSDKSYKGIMEGATLTMEGVCQIYQIIEFLERPPHIATEGIFRKHGNLKKQQLLKERLNRGIPMSLDDGEFSVHECASVLKAFLQELPEPPLTNAYFEAHCQAAKLTAGEGEGRERRLQVLQLLMLLVPDPNYRLLRDLLPFLHRVTQHEDRNKMNALNLGTLFACHIMCPRKMPSEELQANHHLYAEAVAFMITHASSLFGQPPPQLTKDISAHNLRKCTTPKRFESPAAARGQQQQQQQSEDSPVVTTIFSFVDQTKSRESATSTNTETALAELYAQVQSMPDSSKKKRLIRQFNEANGCGTPQATPNSKGGGAAARRMIGDSFKNWIVPKAKVVKEKKSGSYNLNVKTDEVTHHTFRKHSSASDHVHQAAAATPTQLLSTPTPLSATATPTANHRGRQSDNDAEATPTQNQNQLYFKRAQQTYAAMMDECDSMAETKILAELQLPSPQMESNEKENFV